MLGVQGARGRRACLGGAGVARRRHGRWAAQARARGALEHAGARQQAGRACVGAQTGAGRVAWAPGLALGSALDALGPFSIRFDSFFFPESTNEHRSL